LLYSLAVDIVKQSADLSAAIVIRDAVKELYCPQRGTLFKALSAEVSTSFGLQPQLCIHDELGQVRGPHSPLYSAIETSMGASENPLSIVISTQAENDAALLSVLIDDAKTGADPLTKLFFWTAGPELDPFSEDALRAANPAFDFFINKEELFRMMEDAKRMPSAQASYENLILNRRVAAVTPFISASAWASCAGPVDDDVLKKGPLYLGVDLSKKTDLTALAMAECDADEVWHTRVIFFAPLEGIEDRSRRDHADYTLWARQGAPDQCEYPWFHATPGATVSYEYVAKQLCSIADDYPTIVVINFDRWRVDILKAELHRLDRDDVAALLQPFGQGWKDMGPAVDAIEAAILDGKLRHGGSNPCLDMNARHAVVETDGTNRKFAKQRSTSRIDGLVALAMAIGGSRVPEKAKPIEYRMMVLG
jgi:phage terminase large subunit-like protein